MEFYDICHIIISNKVDSDQHGRYLIIKDIYIINSAATSHSATLREMKIKGFLFAPHLPLNGNKTRGEDEG